MKKTLLIFIIFIIPFISFAQEEDSVVYEPGTNIVQLSFSGELDYYFGVSYEVVSMLSKRTKLCWGLTANVGSGRYSKTNPSTVKLSPQLNFLYGNIHHIELGAGLAMFDNATTFVIPYKIGYRYIPNWKGVTFRVSIVPMFFNIEELVANKLYTYPWAGFSFGKVF